MATLRHFAESEICLTEHQAIEILDMFNFKAAGITLTVTDREFAQALLVEALDASYQLGWIRQVFGTLYKPTLSVLSIIKKFILVAAQHWFVSNFNNRTSINLYQIIVDRLAVNFRSVWAMRLNDLPLTW
jgi:hypothetical protein